MTIKDTTINKMKIEIWSDIACPFCYIGKHKLDKALTNFANSNQIEIVWKNYQLDLNLKTDTTKSIYQSLAESKGITLSYAKQMTAGVFIPAVLFLRNILIIRISRLKIIA